MEHKKHYFLVFVITIIVVLLVGFFVRGCVMSQTNKDNSDGNTNIIRRSANINDIEITSEIDFFSFGGRYTVTPKYDIDDLEVTVKFYDKNNSCIKTIAKTLGNVKKDVKANFSISAAEVLDILFSMNVESYTVTGGTVSIFDL